jgi:hypothetical protein
MSPRFRKFLAASEIGGGLILIVLPVLVTLQGAGIAWWYWILFECFGLLAVMAGRWLWRDEPVGRELSGLIQAVQIFQFQTSTLGVTAMAGFQLRLTVSETNVEFGPGLHGTIGFTAGQGMPWFIMINFFSMYALYALIRSAPGERNPAELYPVTPVGPAATHGGGADPLTGGGERMPSSGSD